MGDKPNYSADWNWSDYFDHIVDPPRRKTVSFALDVLGAGQGRSAIDLGCGSGNDTVHMLKAGFHVLAIDSSKAGLERLQARPEARRGMLDVSCESFAHASLPDNIWTNAGFALPFCPMDTFKSVWKNITDHVQKGGIFSGHLFGIEDSWNGKVADMNFHTSADIDGLLKGSTILLCEEEKAAGQDALGRPKFWHVFHIVIQR